MYNCYNLDHVQDATMIVSRVAVLSIDAGPLAIIVQPGDIYSLVSTTC